MSIPSLDSIRDAVLLYEGSFVPTSDEWSDWYRRLSLFTGAYRGFSWQTVDIDYGEISIDNVRVFEHTTPNSVQLEKLARAWPAIHRQIVARIHKVNGFDACPGRIDSCDEPPF